MIIEEDEGIVLFAKPFGERKYIVTILTKNRGLCRGVFRVNKSNKSLLEPGTVVQTKWQARLQDQLGTWSLETHFSVIALMLQNALALKMLHSLCALLGTFLPEKEKATPIYLGFVHLLHLFEQDDRISSSMHQDQWLKAYCYLELFLVEHVAIPLDFAKCAATGSVEDLYYVSPKTGRAVSKTAGAPYNHKLLKLPSFLKGVAFDTKDPLIEGDIVLPVTDNQHEEILAALDLSGYFLRTYGLLSNVPELPDARQRFYKSLENQTHKFKS